MLIFTVNRSRSLATGCQPQLPHRRFNIPDIFRRVHSTPAWSDDDHRDAAADVHGPQLLQRLRPLQRTGRLLHHPVSEKPPVGIDAHVPEVKAGREVRLTVALTGMGRREKYSAPPARSTTTLTTERASKIAAVW